MTFHTPTRRRTVSGMDLKPGTRVTLSERTLTPEARGRHGTIAHTYGRIRRWAIVDVDHLGEQTVPMRDLTPTNEWQVGPIGMILGAAASIGFVGIVALMNHIQA